MPENSPRRAECHARTLRGLHAVAVFVAVVVVANLATDLFGVVTFAGLTATAGTWVAGLSFVARDAVQENLGTRWVAGSVALGAAFSAAFSPSLAIASAVAFTVAELADWAVYTPLRRRSPLGAALASNTVGALLDSVLFLALAGFPIDGALTQTVVKVGTTSALVLLVLGVRRVVLR